MKNPLALCLTDSYKLSHDKFQIKGTEYIYSNQTPRTAKFFPIPSEDFDGKAIYFGGQYFIKHVLIELFNDTFFKQPKEKVIAQFKRRCDTHLGKNSISMDRFEQLHDLQYLPILIKSLPEGSAVPMRVPYLTIINTHPDFAWLTNYLETVISNSLWKPIHVATLIKEYRKLINKFADETVGNRDFTNFSLHNFSARGMNLIYDDAISGAAFLLSSLGTDSVISLELLENYYNANAETEIIGLSVPASEHACSSLGASVEDEFTFIKRSISEYYPTGIVSIVSDTYDYWKVITEYSKELKDIILNRPVNEFGLSKVVFRPDSGDQVKIICGYKIQDHNSDYFNSLYIEEAVAAGFNAIHFTNQDGFSCYEIILKENKYKLGRKLSIHEVKGTIECLWDIFGGTESETGYKILNERVGCILGDGCTYEIVKEILIKLKEKKFASSNMVFGVGSWGIGRGASRDSLGIAQKATWAQVSGKPYELFKSPKTDLDNMKKSAKGLLRVDLVNGQYVLKDQCTPEEEAGGELKPVFLNGQLLKDWTLAEVRANLAAYL